jgi:hypothetical protein
MGVRSIAQGFLEGEHKDGLILVIFRFSAVYSTEPPHLHAKGRTQRHIGARKWQNSQKYNFCAFI